MTINRRISVLLHWLRGTRNGVGVRELLRFLVSPRCQSKARRFVQSLEEEKDVYRVHLNGVPAPLIWPKSIDLFWLYMVVAEQWCSNDWHFYEVPETRVRPGDIVADCGAAEGLFSLLISDRAARVFAIEPLPLWVSCMRRTFASVHNVQILPYALSSETGIGQLQGNGLMSQLTSGKLSDVSVETIDNLFFRQGIQLDVIKADLEGHDLKMLLGAGKTISRHAPRIAITTYHESGHAQAMVDYLRTLNRGYKFRVKGIDAVAGAPVMLHAWT